MAGVILRRGDVLCRFGHDCTSKYGAGIRVFRIYPLSPTTYHETLVDTWWPDTAYPFPQRLRTCTRAGALIAVDAAHTSLDGG